MKRLSTAEKKEALNSFLKSITKNDELFIYSIANTRFTIAIMQNDGGIDVKCDFMTYDEMRCFFLGVLAIKENRIEF